MVFFHNSTLDSVLRHMALPIYLALLFSAARLTLLKNLTTTKNPHTRKQDLVVERFNER